VKEPLKSRPYVYKNAHSISQLTTRDDRQQANAKKKEIALNFAMKTTLLLQSRQSVGTLVPFSVNGRTAAARVFRSKLHLKPSKYSEALRRGKSADQHFIFGILVKPRTNVQLNTRRINNNRLCADNYTLCEIKVTTYNHLCGTNFNNISRYEIPNNQQPIQNNRPSFMLI
jgi:hypothetical protein